MKKFGKFEQMPDGTRSKQPQVKSMLLQTYFTSLLCLVLCVTMFLGTSYAWFTSEIQNTANEIYIGTLDVELEKKVEEKWLSLSAHTDGVNTTKLFDSNIRWEPGYTALETIKVVNKGDLAFKYVLNFTDGSLIDESKAILADAAECFDVWVYDYRANTNKVDVEPNPDSYAKLTAEKSGWVHAGSLNELLGGKNVLEGVMSTVRDENSETPANGGTTDGVATENTYTIALHMKEDADSAVMGQKITLNVKLIAYQMASESEKDGFGNQDYDGNVTAVSNAASLQSALDKGGSIQLITDVEISGVENCVTMNGGVLYGNGKVITYSGERNNESSVGVLTTSGGTIKNLTINGGKNGRALYITKLTEDLFVSDCTLSGAYSFNLNSATATEYTINFTNTIFENWTSYSNAMSCANFTGCTFLDGATLRPYGETILTDCEFKAETLDASKLKSGKSITLTNCIYNGVPIESATITADANSNLTVKCDSGLLVVSGLGVVSIRQG